MLLKKFGSFCCPTTFQRTFVTSSVSYRKNENPIYRTLRILRDDVASVKNVIKNKSLAPTNVFPSHADIVILGGGAMGTSAAYWLKEKTGPRGLSVVVIEKDPTVSLL